MQSGQKLRGMKSLGVCFVCTRKIQPTLFRGAPDKFCDNEFSHFFCLVNIMAAPTALRQAVPELHQVQPQATSKGIFNYLSSSRTNSSSRRR